MKLLSIVICIITFSLISIGYKLPVNTSVVYAAEKQHIAKQGETIWDIAKQYGVPIEKLKEVNDNDNNVVIPGETFIIPTIISDRDKELLSRLVHAEAKGEPYEGKVAVAAVVLNRVHDDAFPDTISKVIYQNNQFSPVDDGSIRQPADEDSKKAVNEALAIQGYTYDQLYFYNPSISDSKWMRTLKVTKIIGGHHFAI
ncbi:MULTISPECIES: cell wall hydrolase [Bacillaceae]|uniref:N-acetylmuramoyl-L-alanine amidase n=1 Tax=Peribacillus huizhouensis TaxID=1501239 RepID=A0ABR6CSS6_9BACI|nr:MULTISPECIES: cell wall hydrolase [Bacillaceae]MBA9027660.1 N-acetylmuramoyl-L-alanine amidase [Peribacillus huizhouensis]